YQSAAWVASSTASMREMRIDMTCSFAGDGGGENLGCSGGRQARSEEADERLQLPRSCRGVRVWFAEVRDQGLQLRDCEEKNADDMRVGYEIHAAETPLRDQITLEG